MRSQLALKLFLLVALNLAVYVPYFFLQHHQFFPVTTVPPTTLDRLIPFWPGSIWVYWSISLLMPIGPFLMNDRTQILRYASGIILIATVSAAIFLFWPTVIPRPVIPNPTAAYQLLIAIDQPAHAIPSLPATFAIYSALCGIKVLRELDSRKLWPITLWLWAALILFATLATKQHMIVDLVAGSALGFAAYACAFHQPVNHREQSMHVSLHGRSARSKSSPGGEDSGEGKLPSRAAAKIHPPIHSSGPISLNKINSVKL